MNLLSLLVKTKAYSFRICGSYTFFPHWAELNGVGELLILQQVSSQTFQNFSHSHSTTRTNAHNPMLQQGAFKDSNIY